MSIRGALGHLKTINQHRKEVRKGCFRVGLYRQGLLHDLSKYSPTEFLVGARYFQGDRSPNNAEREEIGYSSAWLHHKGRNRHHYEYWFDYLEGEHDAVIGPVPMPKKYIVEMFMDRVAACKVYQKENYTPSSPLNYYRSGNTRRLLHPETAKLLEKLLVMLSEKGEEETDRYIKEELLGKRGGSFHLAILLLAVFAAVGCAVIRKNKDVGDTLLD